MLGGAAAARAAMDAARRAKKTSNVVKVGAGAITGSSSDSEDHRQSPTAMDRSNRPTTHGGHRT